ncbi:MAG: coat protein [Circular genetic element sp.]|nr:MAG: coat protein [Circular genetic element sp.]
MASHVIVAPASSRGLQRAYAKEKGYIDVPANNASAIYPLDTTGSVTLLNTVAQGASVNQRVGKKIIMKGLQCRGRLMNEPTGVYNDVAYMIVYDKRPTGSLPTLTEILVDANSYSMNLDANAGRFRILKRVDETLLGNTSLTGAVANALTDRTSCDATWWLDLKSAPVTYKAAGTGAIGDIEEGALYLVTVGMRATGGTDAGQLTAQFRLRFLDV